MGDEAPSRDIHGLSGPLSEAPWSADFVMQSIEILPVRLREGRLHSIGPQHADSFIVAWPTGHKPEEVAMGALDRLGLAPIVLHSTSWRNVGDEVILTYLAVVAPHHPIPDQWSEAPIARSDLARGEATVPPTGIAVGQVIEHGLRHLSWLIKDDPVIRVSLPEWEPHLAEYTPEPFRALGAPG